MTVDRPRLDGPDSVLLSATDLQGPWATRTRRMRVTPFECAFRNPGPEGVTLAASEVEPLRSEAGGSSAPASLWVAPPEEAWQEPLAPGQVATLRLGCHGALPPGRYSSRLILLEADRRVLASVPVVLTVKAHWLWALGCMVLGLSFLGLLIGLAGRATLNERLARALAAQQELHELLERAPPVLADRPLARQAREAAALAVESLSRPRPFGIQDTRLERAERHLAEVRSALATLRERTADRTPGQLAVDALEADWEDLVERLEAARTHLAPRAVEAAPESGLAPLLAGVQAAQWRQRLAPLLEAVEGGLGPHVERVRLALAAGEQERARKLSRLVTLWLRRAARQLDRESDLLLTWRAFAGEMFARAGFLEQARSDPGLPQAGRDAAGRSLAAARELLRPTTLEGFRDAAKELQEAEKALLRVRSAQLVEEIRAAIDAVEERTSLRRIEAALDELTPGDPKEARAGRLLGVLALWRERVATVEEPSLREQFLERIATLEALLEADDLPATASGFGGLLEAWTAYQQTRTEEAMAAVLLPYCRQQETVSRAQQLASEEALALLQPHPDLAGLEAELDRIDGALRAGFAGPDCLDRLVGLSAELLEVGDRLFSTYLLVADLTPEARLASAEHSEGAEAVALARRLMREPRELRLELRTPAAEVRVDRRVTFEVGNLDPGWGPGTAIRIDFGDATPPLLRNAEELRQEPLLQHRYRRPLGTEISAVAEWGGAGHGPEAEVVGEGRLAITVAPSSISLARTLASFFLSVRFALALALGLLVQGFRLYDDHPFGSRRRDYLEAFALGAGVEGLIEGLAATISSLVAGG